MNFMKFEHNEKDQICRHRINKEVYEFQQKNFKFFTQTFLVLGGMLEDLLRYGVVILIVAYAHEHLIFVIKNCIQLNCTRGEKSLKKPSSLSNFHNIILKNICSTQSPKEKQG